MPAQARTTRRIVAFGPMRSGNVLLERLVVAHPLVASVAPLDQVLNAAAARGLGWTDPLPPARAEDLVRLRARVAAPTGAVDRRTLDALHRSWMTQAASGQPFVYVRMHSPLTLLEELAATDDVLAICVVRDPRDVALSRTRRGDRDLARHLHAWRRFARVAERLERRGHALAVRFEDLVGSPDDVSSALTRFTTIAVDLRGAPEVDWPDHSSFGPLPEAPSASAVHRWRAHRDEEVVRFAGHACRRELRAWGYDPPDPVSQRERARFARRLAVAGAKGALRRLRARGRGVLG